VLSEIVADAARQDARDSVVEEFGAGVEIRSSQVQRWLKKLGTA
jgi:hypothetical protein